MKNINISVFFNNYPVFTVDDLVRYLESPERNRKVYDMLSYHRRMGRVERIKEGLYFTVRPGVSPDKMNPDPFLVAGKLAPYSILAYHTALDAMGYAHSVLNSHYYFSNKYKPEIRFRNQSYICVIAPTELIKKSIYYFGTEKKEKSGMMIVTTGKERSLVEALERPKYCGGFEEMYRSLEKMPYINGDVLLEYLRFRGKKSLYAKVGFYLEQNRSDLYVEDDLLSELEKYKPSGKIYWERNSIGAVLAKRWNLLVPNAVIKKSWEEF
jgi:predicted transcriptional regulator of viral defense system